ncbi:MAG: hypothetical protein GXO39_03800 [Thermotogae bacterium]|nr:hypothetical protein [Thermotogota bacterium]
MKKKALIAALLFVGALISAYFALEAYATHKLKEKFDRRIAKLPYEVSYEGFRYNLLLNDIKVTGLKINEEKVKLKIGEVYVDLPFTLRKKAVPQAFTLKAKKIELPSTTPFLGELLKTIGYKKDEVVADFTSSYAFKGKELEVGVALEAKELGAIKTRGKLYGIDRELTQKVFEGRVPPKVFERRGTLEELTLTYLDEGLFKGFLNYLAQQEGESPEKVKEELKKTIEESLRENPEIYERLGKAFIAFVDDPKCLKIKVEPEPPIKLSELVRAAKERREIDKLLKRINLQGQVCSGG